ncbi:MULTISPECIES: hypothetical protein [unclassified Phycicoccus]|uniref:hypothetical protein n=1 Tax=unclassified Phycicoccus TaxID=2637926 RepID=UPI000AA7C996|nr:MULTISPECIES: hypothetical protein [unclassified Phycicoccus]
MRTHRASHRTSRPARSHAAAVLAVGVLLLGGCAASGGSGGATAAGDPGNGSSQASGDSETFDSPEPEPTTPDSSDSSTSDDAPAIAVARLPIGGDAQDDGDDPRLQCAHVTWIASPDGQIPRGTGIEITRVLFDPASFEAVDQGCGSERPSCLHYVFRTSALQCDLPVRATGDVAQDANPSLGFAGLVFCPDPTSATCRHFVGALANEQQLSVSLNVPQLPPGSGDASTDTSSDSGTDTGTDATTDGG